MHRAIKPYLIPRPRLTTQVVTRSKPHKEPRGIADRIEFHDREAAKLRALLALVTVIGLEVPPGTVFSAAELFRHGSVSNTLRGAIAAAGIRNPKQLGRQLQQLTAEGITRIDEVRDGVLWCVAI